jgi:hypothetical protein
MPATHHPTIAAVLALLEDSESRRKEHALLEFLGTCSAAELDAVVTSMDLRALIDAVEDHLLGPQHRTALMRLLTEERLGDLGVPARAALVRVLARGWTTARDERSLCAIFVGTRGTALTALKEAVDAGSDYHDLVQLVFHDIDDDGVRATLLQHIAAEAAAPGGLKILSDIDDTLYANWKDKRYPAKTVYPGVRQLYAELSGSPLEPEAAVVTFVTARPEDPLGLFENATHRALSERGLPRARVLSGAFTRLIGNDAIAEEKGANFRRYRSVFPEYRFVFFGDSGQGDVAFGESIRALAPEAVTMVFIHDVVATPEERRRELCGRGIHFCDTYVGAALAAFEAGLLSAEGLRRVGDAAERELGSVRFESDADRGARMADIARDIDRVRVALGG